MHYIVLLVFSLAVTAISGADTNVTKPEVESVSVNTGESTRKILPSTQRLVESGCICLDLHAPVCATNAETYENDCYLACENKYNPYLFGLCYGECPCCKKPHVDLLGGGRGLSASTLGNRTGHSPSMRRLDRLR